MDKFLKKIVALNIISLIKIREIIARENNVTNHSNYYLTVNNIVDISKLVQLLVKNGVFEEQLSQKCKVEILDLFAYKIIKITNRIPLYKY